eukprot:11553232-Heterocapsa_arctica.AAC.1
MSRLAAVLLLTKVPNADAASLAEGRTSWRGRVPSLRAAARMFGRWDWCEGARPGGSPESSPASRMTDIHPGVGVSGLRAVGVDMVAPGVV